ncbi:MAG: ribbon-helix-helix domain-containing protein [Chloroflexota bacterium]|nr:ribbon-helix-helix domain-containing protein [Chloroflexota bacterium]
MSSKTSPIRRRIKVGATLDPELIGAVDAYVSRHPGADRSAVIDEALRLWHEREQAAAMERQLREDASHYDDKDRVAWRQVRDATAVRRLARPR